MKAAIDRIEEGIAVLIPCGDEKKRLNLPVATLPPGSKEGDIVTIGGERDPEATAAAKERSAALVERLKRK
jgi:hypothetical protein